MIVNILTARKMEMKGAIFIFCWRTQFPAAAGRIANPPAKSGLQRWSGKIAIVEDGIGCQYLLPDSASTPEITLLPQKLDKTKLITELKFATAAHPGPVDERLLQTLRMK